MAPLPPPPPWTRYCSTTPNDNLLSEVLDPNSLEDTAFYADNVIV